jgi:hypothetical protein
MSSLLDRVIQNRKLEFKYRSNFQDNVIEITIPNLEGMPYSQWGDWGPMYSYNLNADYTIKINVKNQDKQDLDSYEVYLPCLTINSPIQAKEREQYPLYMHIPIKERDTDVDLYFDHQGVLSKVKVNQEVVSE